MRRTKRKYTWFPVLGSAGGDEDGNADTTTIDFQLTTPAAPSVNEFRAGPLVCFPVIPDVAKEDIDFDEGPLADYIADEYVLKRIVGKLFIGCKQIAAGTPKNFAVTAGFFVARSDSQAVDVPVGFQGTSNDTPEYGTAALKTVRKPWIWRRQWMLSNLQTTTDTVVTVGLESNVFAGSVLDGPHVDAKTGRRIRQDERLFFAAQAWAMPTTVSTTDQGQFQGYLDVRVLGALRKAKAKSAF